MHSANIYKTLRRTFFKREEEFIYSVTTDRSYSKHEFYTHVIGTANKINRTVPVGSRIMVNAVNTYDVIVLYYACTIASVTFVPYKGSESEWDKYVEYICPDLTLVQEDKMKSYSTNADEIGFIPGEDPDHIVDIFATSGTTGDPKAIKMAISSRVYSTEQGAKILNQGEDDIHYCVLSLLHTASWAYHIWPAILTGARIILDDKFHVSRFWQVIADRRVTNVQLVPTIMTFLLEKKENFTDGAGNTLKYVGCGSSILHRAVKEDFKSSFGIPVINQYGLSEICSTHIALPDYIDLDENVSNVGYPIDGVKIKLTENEGLSEILVSGPTVCQGYFKNKAEDEKVFNSDGYYRTGDLGYLDHEGKLYIIDRIKDNIIKGGVNIAPSLIENIMLLDPNVLDVCVFSLPDKLYGEEIYAAVKLADKTLDTDMNDIDVFKRPKRLFIVDKVPRTYSGKILRNVLRERYKERT